MTDPDQQTVWHEQNLAEPHAVRDKARRVRAMFNAVAPTYELVNTLTSFGRDAYWRRRAVELSRVTGTDRVLDLACGTGDLARAFAAARPAPALVVGADFAGEMIRRAAGTSSPAMRWCQADALSLPFLNEQFTAVSCAFGVRNLQDLKAGFREVHRVLSPDGRAVILEFSNPSAKVTRALFHFYFNRMLPAIATLISRDRSGAYRYLPRSVLRFASRSQIVNLLREVGFERIEVHPLTFGIAVVYLAAKAHIHPVNA
ncbi:MAG: bifunctional demethylmenaquinone methyltransferase/2-methoxy-6-polyprenyl-1,4-benzoquinol methylase UbiE [Phycisphaerales bacterium]|nr:MAG: bifunctional demethylmenaquinone methyltransferase/2-methoxy-6-polyprenyl-1,4-benzoquinol methylase UbiE [Phycisphaerales bacterium]